MSKTIAYFIMKDNELGQAGVRVLDLSFGASLLGRVFGSLTELEGVNAVNTATENGLVRYL